MNNPWLFVGWIVLALIIIKLSLLFIGYTLIAVGNLLTWVEKFAAYWKSRKIKPVEGQIWKQDGGLIYIGRRHEVHDKHFRITTYNPTSTGPRNGASWSETDKDWKNRVKRRRVYLYGEWK